MRHRYTQLLALGLALLVVPVGAAADTGFSATLDNAQTAGTCPGGSPGTGSGFFVMNNAQTELTFNISFAGLSGPVTVAHFHNALPGFNGGVVRQLTTTSPIVGIWKNTDAQPFSPAMVTELLAGRLYINLHTQQCPGGEIRGQVLFDATQTLTRSWGRIKTIYR